jgi:enoyl-CoA hydratase/carnithine racemase
MNEILVRREEGVLTLTFNRVHKKNALTASMYATLAEAIDGAAADAAIRVLLLQGQTEVFTAGNDLGDFRERPAAAADAPVFRFLRAISAFPKPAIAAVCGPAVGIGTTLLLHCDFVYAGDNATFLLPFVDLGLCPEAASSLLLPLRIGPAAAASMLLLGEPLGAEEAHRLGLVSRVLGAGDVNAFADAQARKLAAKPAASLTVTKALLRAPLRDAVRATIAEEGRQFGELLRGPDAQAALARFLARHE